MSEQSPTYLCAPSTPQAQDILASAAASFWLKDALREAMRRDPVDAANDARLLAEVLANWADAVLSAAPGTGRRGQ